MDRHEKAIQDKDMLLTEHGKKLFLYDTIADIVRIALLITFVMLYVAYRIKTGALSVDSFVALFLAVMQSANQLLELVGSFTELYEHSLFIENFREVMSYQSTIDQTKDQDMIPFEYLKHEIEVKDICFSYVGYERYSIDHLDLRLKRSEKLAIAGPNGAGKTTLCKLLLRLYDVDSGQITFDGIDIKHMNVSMLRRRIGVVFQDAQCYAISIAENILQREVTSEADEHLVFEALKNVGLYERVMQLENGINTIMSREFDENGTLLSGGELQKLALARCFAHDFDILLLDEPSSALDPIAEREFFENMMRVCQDKTVIFVTHRLSTVTTADRILYMEKGQVLENGTFDELMNKDGRFAAMFNAQAEYYVR